MEAMRRYQGIAARVAQREHSHWIPVLLRIGAARARFGLSASEYALYELHRKPWHRLSSYLTKKQATALYARFNPASALQLADDKIEFQRRCAAAGLPTVDILAVLSRTLSTEPGKPPVYRGFEELLNQDRLWSAGALVLKPRADSLGTGVRVVARMDAQLVDINGQALDIAAFVHELHHDMQRDDYLVQPFLRAHAALSRLGAGRALGTLRLVTLRSGDDVRIVYGLIRIPGGSGPTDNFLGGAGGNLIAAIDLARGVIGPARGRQPEDSGEWLRPHRENPATGVPIEGHQIPHWSEVTALVMRATEAFPELALLGWDVAVLDDGPCLIEVNRNPDVAGAQTTTGQGIRALLRL